MLTVWVEIALMVATWIGQNQKIRLMVAEINLRGNGGERLRERGRAKAPEIGIPSYNKQTLCNRVHTTD
ncbi:hypothetical protein JHK84_040682 [Glycine max]|nr:hypothetical protein JHK85_041058 [Glycine max]KAG5122342.1 hypothetical protein JHK84_040682 [Glycine max]